MCFLVYGLFIHIISSNIVWQNKTNSNGSISRFQAANTKSTFAKMYLHSLKTYLHSLLTVFGSINCVIINPSYWVLPSYRESLLTGITVNQHLLMQNHVYGNVWAVCGWLCLDVSLLRSCFHMTSFPSFTYSFYLLLISWVYFTEDYVIFCFKVFSQVHRSNSLDSTFTLHLPH